MEVFLNEKSLDDRVDIDDVMLFLSKNLEIIKNTTPQIKVYTFFKEIEKWYKFWEKDFDSSSKTYFLNLFNYVEDITGNTSPFYYHYYSHNDLNITDFLNSGVSLAADKAILGQVISILNVPPSKFCSRSNLPILKSPYDCRKEDMFVNIPCFNNAIKIIQYKLLQESVKPFINDTTRFNSFSNGYYSFIESFDYSNWHPKTLNDDGLTLNSDKAFPASSNPCIKSELSIWRITNGSYEQNQASYKSLGGMILKIHGYIKNFKLSAFYDREIYEAGYGTKKLLISLDTENGALEVIDYSGTHIGVYGYDGSYKNHYTNQTDIDNHSLRNLPKNLFIFIR